ncbi:unnamed protein product [Bursaphelenchus okinawaensis]|uniref:Uncharacterized protein n=1 Tax=Bursaphelenchus okinawaensis TaxID=465554 RepID=A0A811KC93_9BILA|nr:unnamed protein product [Bursaphelenchus okinawaensis]CAG9100778.1 unnamed protein product [Bursaphelenchus okinawaensis]
MFIVSNAHQYYFEDFYTDKGNLTLPITKDESGLFNATVALSVNSSLAESLNDEQLNEYYMECVKNLKLSNPVLETVIINDIEIEGINCNLTVNYGIAETEEYKKSSLRIIHAIIKALDEHRLNPVDFSVETVVKTSQIEKDSSVTITVNTNLGTCGIEPRSTYVRIRAERIEPSECLLDNTLESS